MKALACTVGAVLLGLGAAANAGSLTWDFSFTTSQDSGSGVITTSDTSSGTSADLRATYAITGVTGSVTGVSAPTGSIISGPDPLLYEGADNLLLVPTGTQPFDFNGFSFVLANTTEINLFGATDNSGIYECTSANPTSCNGNAAGEAFPTTSFTITAVPLPDSLSLLGLGLVGLGVFARFARGQRSVGLAA